MRTNRIQTPTLLAAALMACAPPCAAQGTVVEAVPALRRFDVAAYVAWFGGHRGEAAGTLHDDWYAAPLGGVSVGRYWTEHLKTELEVSATGRGRLSSSTYAAPDRDRTQSVFREHQYTLRTVSLTQSYQFLHNAWVHPFVGGALDLDWEQQRVDGWTYTYRTLPGSPAGPAIETLPREQRTRLIPRAAVVIGLKAYFTRHGFFRTDVRAAGRNGVDQVTWRLGLGLDF